MKRFLISTIAFMLMFSVALTARAEGKKKIAVIPKGTTHAFWKSVEAGVRKAGAEFDVEVIWKGPLKEDDRAQQIGVVEQFIADKVDGICLAPLDNKALRRPVDAAKADNIPVVIFDSGLAGTPGKEFNSFVATDNKKGGQIGGEALAKLLGGKGKVVLLRYVEGSASTAEREAGFLEVMKKNPGIEVISDNQYGGSTTSSAKEKAMNMLDKLNECDGIFCPNESSTHGMLLALKDNNLAGKKKFVGFDATPKLVEALKAGECQALVAQNPTKMGYETVKAMARILKGETVDANIDTGCALVTMENLSTPEIQEIVK